MALTTLRLLLGPSALLCASQGVRPIAFLPLLAAGTLSDIYDGILARRFGVSTAALRRYDSITDVIYYLFVLAALWVLRRSVIAGSRTAISLLIASELTVIIASYARFHKYPAAHTYMAKFYGLYLLGTLIALLAFDLGSGAVTLLAAVALLTNAEILLIHLLSPTPPVDVRSLAAMLRSKKSSKLTKAGLQTPG